MINGGVRAFSYSSDGNDLAFELNYHTSSCRSLAFSENPDVLYTASSDCSLGMVDVGRGCLAGSVAKAHDHPINVVRVYDHNLLITGDDDGRILFTLAMNEALSTR